MQPKTRKAPPAATGEALGFVKTDRRSPMKSNTNLSKTANDPGWLTITLRMVNDQAVTVGHVFKVRAKHTNKFTGAILRDGAVELWRNTDKDRCAEIIMALVSDWKHVSDSDDTELKFNRENVVRLLIALPHVGKAIGDALLADLAKGGTTHGDL
jgi:hypothetical protein